MEKEFIEFIDIYDALKSTKLSDRPISWKSGSISVGGQPVNFETAAKSEADNEERSQDTATAMAVNRGAALALPVYGFN